jgi:hypothetical protein
MRLLMFMFSASAQCRFVGRCHTVSIFSPGDGESKFSETSVLKTETVCFSETLASTYESTRSQNPKHHHHHHHCRSESFKPHTEVR